jgi:hypothetical protein
MQGRERAQASCTRLTCTCRLRPESVPRFFKGQMFVMCLCLDSEEGTIFRNPTFIENTTQQNNRKPHAQSYDLTTPQLSNRPQQGEVSSVIG